MEHDEAWLCEMVAKRTKEAWDNDKKPYYISSISDDAKGEGADYKAIIAPKKLRQWAISSKIPGVTVLADRHHSARVGFIPEGKSFDFETSMPQTAGSDSEKPEGSQPRTYSQSRSRIATLRFLDALSTLPEEELEKINIPLKIIVRLLSK